MIVEAKCGLLEVADDTICLIRFGSLEVPFFAMDFDV